MCIRDRGAADRKGIFFVDGKDGLVKDGNKNRLREQDIKRIVDTWNARHDVPHYAKMCIRDRRSIIPISCRRYPKSV